MSLNPFTNYSWNYSNKENPGFSETLIGTVVTLQEVQKRTFTRNGQVGAPEFWDNADGTKTPKMNIRIGLIDPEGQFKTFTFQPASKDQKAGLKPSIHMDLYHISGNNMMNLVGKTIGISTESYDQNGNKITYGAGNPRKWSVGLVEGGPFAPAPGVVIPEEYKIAELLCDSAASGGQVTPQNIQAPQVQTFQPVYQQQQPVMQQQQPVIQQQPVQQQAPMGMDPQLAAAMQNVNAQNITTVYDEEIPF